MATKLQILLKSGRNVFSIDDLSVIWGQSKRTDTVFSARDYVKRGQMVRLKRGLYALDGDPTNLSPGEIANHACAPSYVTGQTVLAAHGLTFQATGEVHSAALQSRRLEITGTHYLYHRVKPEILFNANGVTRSSNGISIATLERAVADLLYCYGGSYAFEDLDGLNWLKLHELTPLYGKQSVINAAYRLEHIHA